MKRKTPKVAVIILNFNGFEDTKGCLDSLIKTTYPNFEIFLVDNGSTNNEIPLFRKYINDKRIHFIRFEKNWGFSGGNNKLIEKTKSEYIALLNNDTVVDKNWLKELVTFMEKNTDTAIAQPKIRSFYNPEYFEYAGAAGGFLDQLGYPYARGRIGFHIEKDVGQYDNPINIFWASGTCIFIRRNILKHTGVLADDFFFYHEETDFCWRIKNMGYRIVFCPKAVIYHKGASSSKKNMPKRIFFVHRNNLLLIARNVTLWKLLWILPMRMGLDIFAGGFYILTNKPRYFLSVLHAQSSFIVMLPQTVLKRIKTRQYYSQVDHEMKPFSIFWQYFVQGKRRYSEIFGLSSQTQMMHYKIMIDIASAKKTSARLSSIKKLLRVT